MRNDNNHDERQIIERGKAFQIGFMTAIVLSLVTYLLTGLFDIRISAMTVFGIQTTMPIMICMMAMILKNAYDPVNKRIAPIPCSFLCRPRFPRSGQLRPRRRCNRYNRLHCRRNVHDRNRYRISDLQTEEQEGTDRGIISKRGKGGFFPDVGPGTEYDIRKYCTTPYILTYTSRKVNICSI